MLCTFGMYTCMTFVPQAVMGRCHGGGVSGCGCVANLVAVNKYWCCVGVEVCHVKCAL